MYIELWSIIYYVILNNTIYIIIMEMWKKCWLELKYLIKIVFDTAQNTLNIFFTYWKFGNGNIHGL